MDRLSILVGRLIKSMSPTNIFFKVPQVGRFLHLVSDISQLVESPLHSIRPSGWKGLNFFMCISFDVEKYFLPFALENSTGHVIVYSTFFC